jgi:hypothetical protein
MSNPQDEELFLDELRTVRLDALEHIFKGINDPIDEPQQKALVLYVQPPPADTCQFLDKLLIEIRRLIYEILLVNEKVSDPGYLSELSKDLYLPLGLCPFILRVNRQIYNEALSILYTRKIFLIAFVHHAMLTVLMRNNSLWYEINFFNSNIMSQSDLKFWHFKLTQNCQEYR